jgi:hypothetical protein
LLEHGVQVAILAQATTGLTVLKSVVAGAHLWRERRLCMPDVLLSDDLQAEIARRGLRRSMVVQAGLDGPAASGGVLGRPRRLVGTRDRLHQPAALGHLLLDPDDGLRADVATTWCISFWTSITNGETGLRVLRHDPRHLDATFGYVSPTPLGLPITGWTGF